MTIISSPKSAKRAEERAKLDRLGEELTIRAIMSTPEGRRWMWLRLAEGQLFVPNPTLDPYEMAFEKGRRLSALGLLTPVQSITPEMYLRMTTENSGVQLNQQQDQDDDGNSDSPE